MAARIFDMMEDVYKRQDPTDPVVRSDNEQTVFMYLPWSTDLTSFFYQNIADLKSIIGQNI